MLLKVDCQPNAVGKQPSIPLLIQWRRQPKKSGGSEPYFFAGEQ